MGKKKSKSASNTSFANIMDNNSYAKFPIQELPDDILVEVFVRVPGTDLAKSCTRVCKRWYDVLKMQKLWKDKCLREYCFTHDTLMTLMNMLHVDFKCIFFHNPYNRNLLQNPDAIEGFKGWDIVRNGGNKFKVEPKPCGCNSLADYAGPNYEGTSCWVTSYGPCYKEQIIDLLKEGCSEEVLDEIRPSINISEWYAARFDCGMKYELIVQLLKDEDDKVPLHEFEFEDTKLAGRDWFNVVHRFENYKPGVRYIKYIHGGVDTQFWAGHYGSKFTLSTVQFDLKQTAAMSSKGTS